MQQPVPLAMECEDDDYETNNCFNIQPVKEEESHLEPIQ
jgi:hypothetical protein